MSDEATIEGLQAELGRVREQKRTAVEEAKTLRSGMADHQSHATAASAAQKQAEKALETATKRLTGLDALGLNFGDNSESSNRKYRSRKPDF